MDYNVSVLARCGERRELAGGGLARGGEGLHAFDRRGFATPHPERGHFLGTFVSLCREKFTTKLLR